jgi:hypothetical protein
MRVHAQQCLPVAMQKIDGWIEGLPHGCRRSVCVQKKVVMYGAGEAVFLLPPGSGHVFAYMYDAIASVLRSPRAYSRVYVWCRRRCILAYAAVVALFDLLASSHLRYCPRRICLLHACLLDGLLRSCRRRLRWLQHNLPTFGNCVAFVRAYLLRGLSGLPPFRPLQKAAVVVR